MKSTYNVFATKESRKKMVSVGQSFNPVKYTKDDFLTPSKVAKKFGISTEKAKEIMKELVFKRAVFALNGHKAPVVIKYNKASKGIYLHPFGIEAFQKHLEKQKD